MSLLVMVSASATVFPLIISVSADEDAIALPHPKVWNFASTMTSFSILR